jgi:hypothetical protein
MTAATMINIMQSLVDENTAVAPFYVNGQDYYNALNQAQMEVLANAVNGKPVNWKIVRPLVVNDVLNDGGTLSQPCYKPLMVTDSTNKLTGKIVDVLQYRGYNKVSMPSMLQGEVDGTTFRTIPAAQTGITIYYLRYPLDISASQDCELFPSVHQEIVMKAFELLVHKDLDAPYTEMIDTERNREELLKQKTGQPVPPELPYQQQR